MARSMLFEVSDARHDNGLRTLETIKKNVTLRPGKYEVRWLRYGIGDTVVLGDSDKVAVGLKIGKAAIAGAGRIKNAREVDVRMSVVDGTFTLPPEGALDLGMSMLQDRGKKPKLVDEAIKALLGKVPSEESQAIMQMLLTGGAMAALSVAAASLGVVTIASKVLDDLFSEHALVKMHKRKVVADPEGPTERLLMFGGMTDFRGINVGYQPAYAADYGVRGDDWMLYTTLRGRFGLDESHSCPGWTRARDDHYGVARIAAIPSR